MSPREAQNDMEQYKMPEVLKAKRTTPYRVGYTATTGNQTDGEPEMGKRADYKN